MSAAHLTDPTAASQALRRERTADGATTRTRVAAALGVLSVIVVFAGLFIHGYPAIGARAQEIAHWATTTDPQQFARGIYIEALGDVLFLLFAAWLWSVAHAAEQGSGWLSTAGFSAAALSVGAHLIGNGVWWAVLDGGRHGTNPQTLATIRDMAQHVYDLTLPLPGVFLFLTGYVLVRTRALPRPVGAAAVLIGLGMLVPPTAQVVYSLVLLWVIGVSLYLLARPGAIAPVRHASGAAGRVAAAGTP